MPQPQVKTPPSSLNAIVCDPPAASINTRAWSNRAAVTRVGTDKSVRDPWPSCPDAPLPQVHTPPSRASAAEATASRLRDDLDRALAGSNASHGQRRRLEDELCSSVSWHTNQADACHHPANQCRHCRAWILCWINIYVYCTHSCTLAITQPRATRPSPWRKGREAASTDGLSLALSVAILRASLFDATAQMLNMRELQGQRFGEDKDALETKAERTHTEVRL